jgi:hypothetical protein
MTDGPRPKDPSPLPTLCTPRRGDSDRGQSQESTNTLRPRIAAAELGGKLSNITGVVPIGAMRKMPFLGRDCISTQHTPTKGQESEQIPAPSFCLHRFESAGETFRPKGPRKPAAGLQPVRCLSRP